MSHRHTVTEHGSLDKDVNNTTTAIAQNAPISSSQSVPGIKTYSSQKGPARPATQIDWSYKPKQTVYVTNQKDSSGNEKKTKYWVCCHRRTTEGRQEYRLKDKAPENWDEYKNCEGDHEGYWVAEDELMEWL